MHVDTREKIVAICRVVGLCVSQHQGDILNVSVKHTPLAASSCVSSGPELDLTNYRAGGPPCSWICI